MTEAKKTISGDRQYRLINQYTRQPVVVPEAALSAYLSVDHPVTGESMFAATGPLPGFTLSPEGYWEAVSIQPDNANAVAKHMGNAGYRYSLSGGKADKRWKAAAQAEAFREKLEIASQSSKLGHFASRALSVATQPVTWATAGHVSYTGLENYLAGEGAQEARELRTYTQPGTEILGTIGGVMLLAAMPIPGAGALGGWLARGGAAGPAAVNVTNLFGLSAAGMQGARTLLAGAPEIIRATAGAIAGAAIFEAPTDLAIASADLIDNNKSWSAEQVVSDATPMFLMGVGLAAAGGLTVGAIRGTAGLGKKGLNWGARKVLSFAAESTARKISGQAVNLKYLHPRSAAATQTMAWWGARAAKRWLAFSEKPAASRLGRFLAGSNIDDFVKYAETTGQALKQMDLSMHPTDAGLSDAIQKVLANIDDPALSGDLAMIGRTVNEGQMREAVSAIQVAAEAAKGYEEAFSGLRWAVPAELQFSPDFQKGLFRGMYDAAQKVAQYDTALATELRTAADRVLTLKPKNAFLEGINARNLLWKRFYPPSMTADAVAQVDNALVRGTGSESLKRALSEADNLRAATVASDRFVQQFAKPEQLTDHATLASMKNEIGSIHRGYQALKDAGLVKTGNPFGEAWGIKIDKTLTELKPLVVNGVNVDKNLAALTRMNQIRNQLLGDATPMFSTAQKVGKEELIGLQLQSAIAFKTRLIDTIAAVGSGGGWQGAGAHGGVIAYRQMDAEEKREEFERQRQILLNTVASPEMAIAAVGPTADSLARLDMELATHYSATLMASGAFLLGQLPKDDEPSSAEIEVFFEQSGALADPISVIASAIDGSVSVEAVHALRSVFPSVYADMVVTLIEFLHDYSQPIKYETMIGFDTFAGGTLGVLDATQGVRIPTPQTLPQANSLGKFGPWGTHQQMMQSMTPAQRLEGF